MIRVMDVEDQTDEEWPISEWVEYYNLPEASRQRIYNVISIEFTHTKLEHLVQAPDIAKKLDWVRFWPAEFKDPAAQLPRKMSFPKVQHYCLMGVAKSYTDFHIDFGGTSVWYHVVRGEKVFLLVPPTEANIKIYDSWLSNPKQDEVFFADLVEAAITVTVLPGNSLLIPTGWIHAVYTPVDSFVFGGNFLHSYNMKLQLDVVESENRQKIKRKFKFPFFEETNWFAIEYYVDKILLEAKKAGARTAKPYSASTYTTTVAKPAPVSAPAAPGGFFFDGSAPSFGYTPQQQQQLLLQQQQQQHYALQQQQHGHFGQPSLHNTTGTPSGSFSGNDNLAYGGQQSQASEFGAQVPPGYVPLNPNELWAAFQQTGFPPQYYQAWAQQVQQQHLQQAIQQAQFSGSYYPLTRPTAQTPSAAVGASMPQPTSRQTPVSSSNAILASGSASTTTMPSTPAATQSSPAPAAKSTASSPATPAAPKSTAAAKPAKTPKTPKEPKQPKAEKQKAKTTSPASAKQSASVPPTSQIPSQDASSQSQPSQLQQYQQDRNLYQQMMMLGQQQWMQQQQEQQLALQQQALQQQRHSALFVKGDHIDDSWLSSWEREGLVALLDWLPSIKELFPLCLYNQPGGHGKSQYFIDVVTCFLRGISLPNPLDYQNLNTTDPSPYLPPAPLCKRCQLEDPPTGQVDTWIGCDYCGNWFHASCLALTAEQAEAIDSYICDECRPTWSLHSSRTREFYAWVVKTPAHLLGGLSSQLYSPMFNMAPHQQMLPHQQLLHQQMMQQNQGFYPGTPSSQASLAQHLAPQQQHQQLSQPQASIQHLLQHSQQPFQYPTNGSSSQLLANGLIPPSTQHQPSPQQQIPQQQQPAQQIQQQPPHQMQTQAPASIQQQQQGSNFAPQSSPPFMSPSPTHPFVHSQHQIPSQGPVSGMPSTMNATSASENPSVTISVPSMPYSTSPDPSWFHFQAAQPDSNDNEPFQEGSSTVKRIKTQETS